jgi:F0F1-type ATP synthase beta subunit
MACIGRNGAGSGKMTVLRRTIGNIIKKKNTMSAQTGGGLYSRKPGKGKQIPGIQ